MSALFEQLKKQALKYPEKDAIVHPRKKFFSDQYHYRRLSFKKLLQRCLSFEQGLKNAGIRPGMRTLVFVKPGHDLAPLTFTLFKMGAIPVFIDPGMGKKNLLACIKKAQPEAMVAEPILAPLQFLYSSFFKSVKIKIYTRPSLFYWPKHTLKYFLKLESASLTDEYPSKNDPDDLAAILFTSGGTGVPKGVCYTHRIFETQTQMLQDLFKLGPSDIDCPGFPLFALFTLSMGATNIIPDMNASKPAQCDPKKIIKNIQDHKATFAAGSPAIWEKVADECLRTQTKLSSVKSVVMFGAPVSLNIHRKFLEVLPFGTTYTPYGATEALPIALTSGSEILNEYAKKMEEGQGTFLGDVVRGVDLKIIQISDHEESEIKECPSGTRGEILVSGDVVTKQYDDMLSETNLAKINHQGKVWHRMGDIGHLDQEGKLWFSGRKSHRVQLNNTTFFSIPCEAIFNQHVKVKRSALIGPIKNEHLGLVIELNEPSFASKEDENKFLIELKEIAKSKEHTKAIDHFYTIDSFPVDVRHNIKIDRLLLRDMASQDKLKKLNRG